MKKPKCPDCKRSKYVSETYCDCPTCSCEPIYCCVECMTDFDKNGEEV